MAGDGNPVDVLTKNGLVANLYGCGNAFFWFPFYLFGLFILALLHIPTSSPCSYPIFYFTNAATFFFGILTLVLTKKIFEKLKVNRCAFLALLVLNLTACHPARFFYYPNRVLYVEPREFGIDYKMVKYPSLNGKIIKALVFEANQSPKGTVVHFHGNFANVSNHLTQSFYLTKYGFDVLIFDYQGYGGSEGKPTPKNTVEDGLASVRFAHENLRNPKTGVVVLGQSLGGAVASVVAAKEPLVKGVILESPFSSYRSMARHAMGRSIFLWPLYPLYPFLLSKKYDPLRYVEKISPRPVLYLHGTKDRLVPIKMSKKLFNKTKQPKEFMEIKNAVHLGCRRVGGLELERKIADFFTTALDPSKSNDLN